MKAASKAGKIDQDGYTQICVDYRSYRAARLALFICTGQWPHGDAEHKDGDRQNDKIENLRAASRAQNLANRGAQRNNTSGFKGVFKHAAGRWTAKIAHKRKQIYLGIFDTPEEAASAYRRKTIELNGEFARTEKAA